MKCPYCDTYNPAGETFCINCGGHLNASPPTTGGDTGSPAIHTADDVFTDTATIHATSTDGGGTITRTLTPDTHLQDGRYVVEKILGEGGMGAAVLARDTRVSNKRVVIKELIAEGAGLEQREENVRNFEREVETLAHLDHPLIPSVTDSFQEGLRYYMVQEYVAGENLEKHIERTQKPMPEQEALTYASQVLDILEYLGRQKPPIVHRDIKPANIIISTNDKRAHLVDFGIARADVTKNAKRKQTSALGTPGYAPPEQYQGNADTRSDLYALGATLYHLLTNRDPADHSPFSFPPIRTLNPRLSPEIERVLEHALMIDITKRYQSATAMKEDIEEILRQRFQAREDTSGYLRGLGPINTPSSSGITTSPGRRNPPSSPPYGVPPYNPSRYQSGPLPRIPDQQQQAQMYAPTPLRQRQAPPMYAPPNAQSQGSGYLVFSFVMLIVVIAIIAAVLFLRTFAG